MRAAFTAAVLSLAVLAPAAALAQGAPTQPPGKVDAARVQAGSYNADPEHTLVAFTVDHMGFNNYYGLFGGATGVLTLDPKNLAASKVAVTIPLSRLTVANDQLKTHMSGKDFFEVSAFPTATFTSTKITRTGPNTARIAGDLVVKGKSAPVTLEARFTGAGKGPMGAHADTVGFEATGSVMRTALGIGYGVPMVSDKVDLKITAAFERKPG